MKNLKKVTALVIVLAMALSSVAFASFSDVSEDASYNEAVQVMSSLGLLVGYEDGTFGPDKTITRAEFAAVIVRALGMEDAAKGASVNTIFTDVPADHWASGYVQIANQQGIILGYGDGNFGPDDEVLYEQAVKMIECALGYGVKFRNVADAYPTSYLAQANADGITVGASGKIGDKASRAVVARLVYNSLDVPMMEQTTIGGSNGDEYAVNQNMTLLTSKLKIAKVEGNVDQLYFGQDRADEIAFKVTKEDDKYYNYRGSNDLEEGSTVNLTYSDNIDVASMRGYNCIAYVDMNDDDLVLKAIAPKAGRNKTLTLNKKQVDKVDFDNNELSYYKNDSNDDKALKVKLDSEFKAYLNASNQEMETADFKSLYEKSEKDFTSIKLINNDSDTDYDLAIVQKYGSFVVDTVNTNTAVIYANTSAKSTFANVSGESNYKVDLDPDNEKITYTIKDKDGKTITLDDIKKDNVANVAVSEDDENNVFYDIVITDTIVTGTINEENKSNDIKYYKIGDGEYKVANNEEYVKVGDEGSFIIDMSGNILFKTDVVSGGSNDFAFLIGLEAKSEFNSYTFKASILNQKGEYSVVTFANKVAIDGATQAELKCEVDKEGNIIGGNWKDNILPMQGNLIGYKTNSSGEISKIYGMTKAAIEAMNSTYSVKTFGADDTLRYKGDNQLGAYTATDDTNIFNADVTTLDAVKTAKKDDMSVVKISALEEDDEYSFKTLVCDEDNNIIAALGYDITAIAAKDSAAMFVTSDGTKNDSNGDPATLLKGYVNGESVEIIVTDDTKIKAHAGYNTNKEYGRDDIKKGWVIQYNADSKGEASGVSVLFEADEVMNPTAINASATDADFDESDEDFFVYGGYVQEVNGTRVNFRRKMADESYSSVVMKGAVPTVKVTLNDDGTIRSTKNNAAIMDIETDKQNGGVEADNNEVLIVAKYDDVSLIAIIVSNVK